MATLALLATEIFFICIELIPDILTNTVQTRSKKYNGLAANINITAFSITYKLPFVIYQMIFKNDKNKIKYFFSFTLLILSIITLIVLGTRGAFLAVSLIVTVTIIYLLFINRDRITLLKFIPLAFGIFTAIFISNQIINNNDSKFLNRYSTISIDTKDGSVDSRLNYYSHVLTSFLEKPFGVGVGNWKIFSIKYDSQNMREYTVAYHAHNDFLQILAETGPVSLILYSSIFLISIFYLIKSVLKKDSFALILLMSLLVYLIDALLNFPISRPLSQIYIAALLCIIFFRYFKIDIHTNRILAFIIIILLIPSIYYSYEYYKSLREQLVLVDDYNSGDPKLPLKTVISFNDRYPNLTETSVPIYQIKAKYLMRDNKFDSAYNYLHSNRKVNPFLQFKEFNLGLYHKERKNIDSSDFYFKTAFEKMPNNSAHNTNYFLSLIEQKNLNELENAYRKVKYKSLKSIKAYIYSKMKIQDQYPNYNLFKIADSLSKIHTNDKQLLELKRSTLISEETFKKSSILINKANKLFESGQYKKAKEVFTDLVKLDPYEGAHVENIGLCFLKMNRLQKAKEYFFRVINEFDLKSGDSEYYLGSILISERRNTKGCEYLIKSLLKGNQKAKSIHTNFCN